MVCFPWGCRTVDPKDAVVGELFLNVQRRGEEVESDR